MNHKEFKEIMSRRIELTNRMTDIALGLRSVIDDEAEYNRRVAEYDCLKAEHDALQSPYPSDDQPGKPGRPSIGVSRPVKLTLPVGAWEAIDNDNVSDKLASKLRMMLLDYMGLDDDGKPI